MDHPSSPDPACQPPTFQPSLPLVVGETDAGQLELTDPGPRVTAPPAKPDRRDDRTLPIRWKCTGHAPGASWRRKGTKGGRPELEAAAVMAGALAVAKHAGHERKNGREWKNVDTETMRELEARSWGVGELSKQSFIAAQRMVEQFLWKTGADGRVWCCHKYARFLGALVTAYQAGALTVILSLEEIASEFAGSRATARRWVADMIAHGWLYRVPQWREAKAGEDKRRRCRNAYQIGRPLERELGAALLDRCSTETRGVVPARTAQRCAQAARANGRRARREHQRRMWAHQRRGVSCKAETLSPAPAGTPRKARRAAAPDVPLKGRVKLTPQPSKPSACRTRGPEGPRGVPAGAGDKVSALQRPTAAPADQGPTVAPTAAHAGNPAAPGGAALDGSKPDAKAAAVAAVEDPGLRAWMARAGRELGLLAVLLALLLPGSAFARHHGNVSPHIVRDSVDVVGACRGRARVSRESSGALEVSRRAVQFRDRGVPQPVGPPTLESALLCPPNDAPPHGFPPDPGRPAAGPDPAEHGPRAPPSSAEPPRQRPPGADGNRPPDPSSAPALGRDANPVRRKVHVPNVQCADFRATQPRVMEQEQDRQVAQGELRPRVPAGLHQRRNHGVYALGGGARGVPDRARDLGPVHVQKPRDHALPLGTADQPAQRGELAAHRARRELPGLELPAPVHGRGVGIPGLELEERFKRFDRIAIAPVGRERPQIRQIGPLRGR